MRERCFELANALQPLRIGNQEVVGVQRKREEAALVRIAHEEELLGAGLSEKRLYVLSHPANLSAHRPKKRHHRHPVPLVSLFVLEMDQVQDVDRRRELSTEGPPDGF